MEVATAVLPKHMAGKGNSNICATLNITLHQSLTLSRNEGTAGMLLLLPRKVVLGMGQ
jgi:hypothetical protein